MNREDLLHSLKDSLAECRSADQKKRVQDLSKERLTDDWLCSCGQSLDDEQLLQSRTQQMTFIDRIQTLEHVSEIDDDAVTTADLEYIISDASVFVGLDASSSWLEEATESTISEAEYNQGTSAKKRTILSLSRACKSGDVTLTPPDASVPGQPVIFEEVRFNKARSSDSDGYYSNIQELVGAIDPPNSNEFYTLLEEEQGDQSDCYEPENDFFDNEEILVEQDEFNYGLTDEFDIYGENIDEAYAAYAFDPDDVYDCLDSSAFDDELPDGKVSREDRALQKSVELISRAGWSLTMLPLVQQIFVMSGWGVTRLALEREIDKGMTPDELILAAHVKALWAENDYYWIAYDKSGSSNLSQYVISWPTALQLVRVFESLPQVEELEQFIETLFEYWYDRSSLHQAFHSFSRFLWFRIFNLQGILPSNLPFTICRPYELPVEEYSDLGICDPLGIEHTAQLRAFGLIQTKHPQEPGCYGSDKPLPVDAYSIATQTSKENSRDA